MMAQDVSTIRIAGNGWPSRPPKYRRQVGLENGGVVIIRVEDGEIRIWPVRAVVKESQNRAAQYFAGSGELVEQFLADRQEAALLAP